MRHAIKLTLMGGVAVGASMTLSGNSGHAQGADPNAAPNPYKMQENWAQLTDGRKFGQAIKVQVDHSDGRSIWVFDRCASNDCSNSMIPPIQKFDASGKLLRAFGANMFNQPHGFYVDHEGNVWVADERAQKGLFLAFQYPHAIPGVTVTNFLRSAINAVRKARAGGVDDPITVKEFRAELMDAM